MILQLTIISSQLYSLKNDSRFRYSAIFKFIIVEQYTFNLKFTTEIQENNSIHFRDLTIRILNGHNNFKKSRKPTHTDHTIHSSSNHP